MVRKGKEPMKINIPTKITIARIVAVALLLCFLTVATFLKDSVLWDTIGNTGIRIANLIACVVFILASATDYLDGHLARKWNQVTDLGKFLDPIADKMLVNSILVYACVPFVAGDTVIPWFCVALMIIRDLIVDTMRLVAAKKGKVVAANIFGKMKTVFQMVAIPVVLLGGWPFTYFDAGWGYGRICLILIYLATAMSVVSGVIYMVQNAHILKEENDNGGHA